MSAIGCAAHQPRIASCAPCKAVQAERDRQVWNHAVDATIAVVREILEAVASGESIESASARIRKRLGK